MKITKKWLKDHFLCTHGLTDVTGDDDNFTIDHNDLIDKYIDQYPEWMPFLVGMMVDSEIYRLKIMLDLINIYKEDIKDEDSINILSILNKMVSDGKITNNTVIEEFFLNKSVSHDVNKEFIHYACAYTHLCSTNKFASRLKIIGGVVEGLALWQNKTQNIEIFKTTHNLALKLRVLLNEYLDSM